jgi:saccharopine dehydrogenase-like NADP-dependent oxidoreductase
VTNGGERNRALRVLIVGGYGFFGSRIAATLAGDVNIELFIGGRDRQKARLLARSVGLDEHRAVAIDASDGNLSRRIADLRIDLVIHTAGPFQGQDYRVARAAVDAGAHYADLADGRAFVSGIVELDAVARDRGVMVTSGASSVPALSTAVVDRYVERFEELTAVHIGISSSGRTPGPATMRGVFGYCGKAFSRLEDGAWRDVHGWMNVHRHEFPAPVGRRWLADCDVPDLALLPRRHPSLRTVTFQAGLSSAMAHWSVWGGAALVRAGFIRNLAPMTSLLHSISCALEPVASIDSAMFVVLRGRGRDGAPLEFRWHLVAENGDGPFIPCGAAIALARKLARGDRLSPGAMPCIGVVTLDEYNAAIAQRAIREVVR